ncbi:MAG: hypothetical protein H6718_25440 [Polyangiaceae bacterium]|nr:hypothetical protein [Myxococcales bacterium]MCB9588780.1 hypothetical protein [Polyangiaceae bacterium]MCB9605338.1 hypothetical protein [Polyangiaceae bacterium]
MLLIGSRAILRRFPEFRPPKDWDLIGSSEEIRELGKRLPQVSVKQADEKFTFQYGNAFVEVANSSTSEYWGRVQREFDGEPLWNEPVLGPLRIAPAEYLLLTKQCGLVYNIYHWHKNLEDLYFLKDRLPVIPEPIAALQPLALEDSRRLFGESHAFGALPRTCHPDIELAPRSAMHREIHAVLESLGIATMVGALAWRGFPEVASDVRAGAMERLLAVEAMVLAAEDFRERGSGHRDSQETEFAIGALRQLCTGCLPVGWRYFCVNHFREILALIPQGFLSRLGDLVDGQKVFPHGMKEGLGCDTATRLLLHPAATGAARLPHVASGTACLKRRAASELSCSPLPE